MDRYPRESHPFFLVRKASLLVSLGGGAIAVNLYMTNILADSEIIDKGLDSNLELLSAQVSDEANETLKKSKECKRISFQSCSLVYPKSPSSASVSLLSELEADQTAHLPYLLAAASVRGARPESLLAGVDPGGLTFL
ncbi:hypothetical protein HYPSUDRAFT_263918 [Hypholoma sublateritium FD-334 SS-4]|uniref:Uncharacterized protein n=1 Tax=Hypholoma sublateritium (strain FD-334 SS-4) TaxID=945553 RepID=A0A0D2QEY4_HYPSF|nr:hypothetical protein HYPSUDRAFT_263918 [Hypholoma sublateritium FD-334 SS-4]